MSLSGSIFGQKDQKFSTVDLLTLVFVVGGTCTVLGAVLAQALQDDRPTRTHALTESFARELAERQIALEHRAQSPLRAPGGTRGPASVSDARPALTPLTDGQIGKDAWGNPFRYSMKRVSESDPRYQVFVWSFGPNGRDESGGRFESATSPHAVVGGDDIGHVEEFKSSL